MSNARILTQIPDCVYFGADEVELRVGDQVNLISYLNSQGRNYHESRTSESRRREDELPEVDRDDEDKPRFWTQYVTQTDIEPPQANILPNSDRNVRGVLKNGRELPIDYRLYKREPHYCGSISFPEHQKDIQDRNRAPQELVYLFKGQEFNPTPIRRKPPNCRLRNRQPGDPWLIKPYKTEKEVGHDLIPDGDYLRDPWDYKTNKVHIPNVSEWRNPREEKERAHREEAARRIERNYGPANRNEPAEERRTDGPRNAANLDFNPPLGRGRGIARESREETRPASSRESSGDRYNSRDSRIRRREPDSSSEARKRRDGDRSGNRLEDPPNTRVRRDKTPTPPQPPTESRNNTERTSQLVTPRKQKDKLTKELIEHRQKWLDWRKTVNFQQVCRESPATKEFPVTTRGWRSSPATSTATSGELERVLAQENSLDQENARTARSTPEIPSLHQTVKIATSEIFMAGQQQLAVSEHDNSGETTEEDELNISSTSIHSANTDIADNHQITLADFAISPQYETIILDEEEGEPAQANASIQTPPHTPEMAAQAYNIKIRLTHLSKLIIYKKHLCRVVDDVEHPY
ncbi:unnamed protein product [Allacma fusca]|uniref:Uncharacterized protein n=1 Tax=Allacma fusca TaxID=39272 RepID=A0A8J2P038_9HEXA|nr:unnamed protein product [Allacma fusca]